jgi:hypothetical protein
MAKYDGCVGAGGVFTPGGDGKSYADPEALIAAAPAADRQELAEVVKAVTQPDYGYEAPARVAAARAGTSGFAYLFKHGGFGGTPYYVGSGARNDLPAEWNNAVSSLILLGSLVLYDGAGSGAPYCILSAPFGGTFSSLVPYNFNDLASSFHHWP